MVQITEDYVSFETAKLLKEKGFDLSEFYGKWAIDYDNIPNDENNTEGEIIIAEWHYPLITLQMARKWLKKEHNILIVVDYEWECDTTPYYFKIYRLDENGKPKQVPVKGVSYDKDNNPIEHIIGYRDWERSYKDFSSCEEACEAAIKYCLENLI